MGGLRAAAAGPGLLITLTLTLGCGRDRPPAAEGPYGREVAEAIPKIEEAVGLKFKTPPVVQARSKEEVRSYLEQRFREDVSEREITGTQTAYQILGAISDTLDLRAFMLDLLTEQVVGYYDPAKKVLYVVRAHRRSRWPRSSRMSWCTPCRTSTRICTPSWT